MGKETARQRKAYDYYYSLGRKRNYREVAAKFNVSETAVGMWGGRFEWGKRVKRDDETRYRNMRSISKEALIKDKITYRKIIKGAIKTFLVELQNGNIKINSVNDLVKLLELDMKLAGIDVNLINKLNKELDAELTSESEVGVKILNSRSYREFKDDDDFKGYRGNYENEEAEEDEDGDEDGEE